MEKEKDLYLRGNSKMHQFQNGGEVLNHSINIFDFLSNKEERGRKISEFADADGWIQLKTQIKKEVDQFGNTHSTTINTWKPDPKFSKGKAPDEEEPPF